MNLMLGDSKTLDSFASGNQTAGYQVKRRLSQFGRQSPASTFVMIEEHPDSINDGALVTELSNQNTIYDWPANFSNRGFWISFADGRVELWKFSGTHFQRAFSGTTVSTSGLSQNETNSFRRLLDVTAVK